jgi:hypothetical protein
MRSTSSPWLLRYLAELTPPRQALWCYLIWWCGVVVRYFDASPTLWLSSLGISAIIGTGLYLSTAHGGRATTALEPWQIARLYMMPFCVSSFAALIKGRGFVLVFHPSVAANVAALVACGAFLCGAALARRLDSPRGVLGVRNGRPSLTPSDVPPASRQRFP